MWFPVPLPSCLWGDDRVASKHRVADSLYGRILHCFTSMFVHHNPPFQLTSTGTTREASYLLLAHARRQWFVRIGRTGNSEIQLNRNKCRFCFLFYFFTREDPLHFLHAWVFFLNIPKIIYTSSAYFRKVNKKLFDTWQWNWETFSPQKFENFINLLVYSLLTECTTGNCTVVQYPSDNTTVSIQRGSFAENGPPRVVRSPVQSVGIFCMYTWPRCIPT